MWLRSEAPRDSSDAAALLIKPSLAVLFAAGLFSFMPPAIFALCEAPSDNPRFGRYSVGGVAPPVSLRPSVG